MAEPDLGDLNAFAAVARHRSFRGAAAQRGISASTLSEAVRRLETRLGVRLLNRTTRSVTPTEAGAKLLERLEPALAEMSAAIDVVNSYRESPTGTLRLNVPVIVSRYILPPIIEAFMKRHPGITVEVMSENNFVDVLAGGFDAGIRYGERLEQDMIAVPIGPRVQRFIAAATPDYLDRHGRPAHPRDLLEHACIRHRFQSGVMPAWEFEKDGQSLKVEPTGPLVSSDPELQVSAGLAGLGIVWMFEEYLAAPIASGALEPVLEDWSERFQGPWLYYASRRHMPTPLRHFVDFIKDMPR